ncbi:hypothetical protein [Streptomyces sp. JJ38]|uniref:hypothetical protein n=1 Tax=Streptomyces sp. JJ38 TaxID=2738128 RepID=UPI001C55DB66|nr:hypothetical protein [Streptomyces sp. JJ38]MBW1596955.1 hypothetical protein [Streptomyces sp. JJ38]
MEEELELYERRARRAEIAAWIVIAVFAVLLCLVVFVAVVVLFLVVALFGAAAPK